MVRVIEVHVKPNASETKIIEESKQIMKVSLSSPAKKGEANQELIKLLKKHFNKDVRIIRGLTNKKKLILVED